MKGKKQIQGQIEIEAVVLEEMQECLYDSLEWLEVYVEKAGYYPDWQQRKQLPKSIERENVQFMNANEVKGFFSTVLFSLSNFAKTSGVPFVLERLQTQFYSWLDRSGINADNCSKELAECLVNIDNVLNGKGEEFRNVRREEVRKNISQMTPKEQEGKFYGAITELQKNLKNEEAWLEAAKNKSLQDVKMEDKFFGNADQGKKKFELIKRQLEISQREEARRRELEYLNRGDGMEIDESSQYFYQKQSPCKVISNPTTPNSNNSNLGTISLIIGILVLASLGIYGVVKKSKKVKNSR